MMLDEEFVLHLPQEIQLPIVLPPNKPATPRNAALVDLYSRIAEYANEARRQASEGYSRDYNFEIGKDGSINGLKDIIKGICYEVLDLADEDNAEDTFEAPADVLDALKFLDITWPPLNEEEEGGAGAEEEGGVAGAEA